jgi:putative endonuclease
VAEIAGYSVYLIRCRDGSLYTGIATDVERRLAEHRDGRKGARYLRGRGPLSLVFQRHIGSRSLASRIEARIKRLSKADRSNPARLQRCIDELLAQLGEGD